MAKVHRKTDKMEVQTANKAETEKCKACGKVELSKFVHGGWCESCTLTEWQEHYSDSQEYDGRYLGTY